jgi:hypothetical protein
MDNMCRMNASRKPRKMAEENTYPSQPAGKPKDRWTHGYQSYFTNFYRMPQQQQQQQ